MCVSNFCPDGTYPSTLQPGGQLDSLTLGNLHFGSDICVPCNELCEVCTGEGTSRSACPLCKYARSADMCVRECDRDTGE